MGSPRVDCFNCCNANVHCYSSNLLTFILINRKVKCIYHGRSQDFLFLGGKVLACAHVLNSWQYGCAAILPFPHSSRSFSFFLYKCARVYYCIFVASDLHSLSTGQYWPSDCLYRTRTGSSINLPVFHLAT